EYFIAPAAPNPIVKISATTGAPPFDRIPAKFASMMTPKAVTYDNGPIRYNDYCGRALAIYDFSKESGEIWSEDFDLLYELIYLTALSRIGEIHDLRGIHRVHALGIAKGARGAIVLLPEGGGKSTLALRLLAVEGVRILSDDTPLISREKMLAFPTRIGLKQGEANGIDPAWLRTMHRREHGTKTLIDIGWFRDRIASDARPFAVVIGRRHGGADSWIEPIAKIKAGPALAANLVFGLGLPQIIEYFLRGGVADTLRKGGIMASRAAAAIRVAAQARCFRLAMGRDIEGAARAVVSVLGS
ncbi:MAG TPA: hypothetical protein VEF03_09900, partial [Candidatus Binataceae bacterium]|nr:hypothetical protein [Candidatus Binataceae bacterium]